MFNKISQFTNNLESDNDLDQPPEISENAKEFLGSLSRLGFSIADENVLDSRRLSFSPQEDIVATIKVNFEGENYKDLAITNMTVFPETRTGVGSSTLNILKENSVGKFSRVVAVQISDPESENFWIKNGFTKCIGENPNNDYEFKL